MDLQFDWSSNRRTWDRINRKIARSKDEKVVRVVKKMKKVGVKVLRENE